MKDSKKRFTILNRRLADQLSKVKQYMVHSEMSNHWGYGIVHKAIETQTMEEIRYADWTKIKRAQINQLELENYLKNLNEGALN